MPLVPRQDPGLRELISYLVARSLDRGATLTQTKLVKLLYLVDVGRAASRRQALTGLRWRFYHYGPYALELPDTLDAMEGMELVVRDVRRGDRDSRLYVGAPGAPEGDTWPEPTRHMVDALVDRWATSDLNELLDYVYFETEPMREAERGEYLDLSKSEPAPRYVSLSPGQPDPDVLARLRTAAAERLAALRDPEMDPTDGPFDDVWDEACNVEREIDGRPPDALLGAELVFDRRAPTDRGPLPPRDT